jgi:hypothetical protein
VPSPTTTWTAISHGDLLLQLCAAHRDTVGNAMLDLLAHTSGAPLYATSPDAPDNFDPIYTNDPQV